jgi:preprotein translocase SecE subunit
MTTRRQGEQRSAPILNRPSGSVRFRFFAEVVSELRKVVWPSREEATRLTIMVVFIAVAVGLALGLLDLAFSAFIRNVLI